MQNRLKVAFFIDDIADGTFQKAFYDGLIQAVDHENMEVNVLIGAPILRSEYDQFSYCKNQIYAITAQKNLYDIIFISTTLANYVSQEEELEFLKQFGDTPVIFIGAGPENYYQILADNEKGMYDLVSHMVRKHNYRHLAFIKGVEGSKDAEERLTAYINVLKENNIPYNEELVLKGNFLDQGGYDATEKLMSKGLEVEAIIGANDNSIIGAKDYLEKNGYDIPAQIAIAGFDNILKSSNILPSLTTVAQPFKEMFEKAIEISHSIKANKNPEKIYHIPAQVILRQSCGCLTSEIEGSHLVYLPESQQLPEDFLEENLQDLKSAIMSNVRESGGSCSDELLENFIRQCFYYIFQLNENNDVFSPLSKIIRKTYEKNIPVGIWTKAIFFLRQQMSPLFHTRKEIEKAEKIFNKCRSYIFDISSLQRGQRHGNITNQLNQLLNVNNILADAIEYSDLENAIYEHIPSLSLDNILVSLFTNKEMTRCKVLALFRDGKSYQKEIGNYEYDAGLLFPKEDLAFTASLYLTYPLSYRENIIGFIIFEKQDGSQMIYPSLASQISRTINNIDLISRIKKAESDIAERSNNIEALVRPMIKSIEEVKNLSLTQSEEVKKLNAMGEESSDKVIQSTEVASELESVLKQTNQLLNAINDISETIDIVALNASIEAAHAGNFGRGFTVIAKEVRKLSDNTRRNVEQINLFLESISKGILNFISLNKDLETVFNRLKTSITDVSDSLSTVYKKMGQLDSTSNSILTLMEQD